MTAVRAETAARGQRRERRERRAKATTQRRDTFLERQSPQLAEAKALIVAIDAWEETHADDLADVVEDLEDSEIRQTAGVVPLLSTLDEALKEIRKNLRGDYVPGGPRQMLRGQIEAVRSKTGAEPDTDLERRERDLAAAVRMQCSAVVTLERNWAVLEELMPKVRAAIERAEPDLGQAPVMVSAPPDPPARQKYAHTSSSGEAR